MTAPKCKIAGGRNLAGQRAPMGTDHRYVSKTTGRPVVEATFTVKESRHAELDSVSIVETGSCLRKWTLKRVLGDV
jgi:hypothetical protein